jgi:hypothetical protein
VLSSVGSTRTRSGGPERPRRTLVGEGPLAPHGVALVSLVLNEGTDGRARDSVLAEHMPWRKRRIVQIKAELVPP